ncbi:hypothetical protein ACH47Z_44495 [Streptomyces sp. NPDC020192]|uniref:hypothetical protein n=1 Tax=Streptomyces sp. NPDC020192 TaxID=3365066 RepID=UPI0037BB1E31
MTERVSKAPDAWPDRMWRLARWALLLVLLLSFITTLLRVVPAHGSTRALVADIKAGRTHTVQTDAEGIDVTVRWSTGLLDDHSYVYHPAGFVPGTDQADQNVRATVTRAAGPAARAVRFHEFDATYGAGGLSLLLPVTSVLLTPWTWLRFLALFAGGAILARMLTARRHRLAEGAAWVLAALVTGAGFAAYLWAEPGREGPAGRAPRWWRAWLASLATGVGAAALGAVVLLVAGRL